MYIYIYIYIHTGAGHIIRISSKSWFISLIPFKKWNLYNVYIHSTQTDIFQVFISFNFDDYNWQLMKTPNSVSQKFRILLKTNTKKGFLKSWPTEKYEHEKYEDVQHSILSWGSFCLNYCSNAAWHGVDQSVHCSGVMRAQVALIVAFSSSALLGLAYRIFLFTIPQIFYGVKVSEFAGQLRTGIPWSLNQVLVALALCAGAKSCWKMKSASP